jgi:uncharacterized Rmd1/YagE family protein
MPRQILNNQLMKMEAVRSSKSWPRVTVLHDSTTQVFIYSCIAVKRSNSESMEKLEYIVCIFIGVFVILNTDV